MLRFVALKYFVLANSHAKSRLGATAFEMQRLILEKLVLSCCTSFAGLIKTRLVTLYFCRVDQVHVFHVNGNITSFSHSYKNSS